MLYLNLALKSLFQFVSDQLPLSLHLLRIAIMLGLFLYFKIAFLQKPKQRNKCFT